MIHTDLSTWDDFELQDTMHGLILLKHDKYNRVLFGFLERDKSTLLNALAYSGDETSFRVLQGNVQALDQLLTCADKVIAEIQREIESRKAETQIEEQSQELNEIGL